MEFQAPGFPTGLTLYGKCERFRIPEHKTKHGISFYGHGEEDVSSPLRACVRRLTPSRNSQPQTTMDCSSNIQSLLSIKSLSGLHDHEASNQCLFRVGYTLGTFHFGSMCFVFEKH